MMQSPNNSSNQSQPSAKSRNVKPSRHSSLNELYQDNKSPQNHFQDLQDDDQIFGGPEGGASTTRDPSSTTMVELKRPFESSKITHQSKKMMGEESPSDEGPDCSAGQQENDDEIRHLIEQVDTVIDEVAEVDGEYATINQIDDSHDKSIELQNNLTNNFTIRLDFRDTKIAQLVSITQRLSSEVHRANTNLSQKKQQLEDSAHELQQFQMKNQLLESDIAHQKNMVEMQQQESQDYQEQLKAAAKSTLKYRQRAEVVQSINQDLIENEKSQSKKQLIELQKKDKESEKQINELKTLNMQLYAKQEKEFKMTKMLEDQNRELRVQISMFEQEQITENQFYQDEMFHLNEQMQYKDDKIQCLSQELQVLNFQSERQAEVINNLKKQLSNFEQRQMMQEEDEMDGLKLPSDQMPEIERLDSEDAASNQYNIFWSKTKKSSFHQNQMKLQGNTSNFLNVENCTPNESYIDQASQSKYTTNQMHGCMDRWSKGGRRPQGRLSTPIVRKETNKSNFLIPDNLQRQFNELQSNCGENEKSVQAFSSALRNQDGKATPRSIRSSQLVSILEYQNQSGLKYNRNSLRNSIIQKSKGKFEPQPIDREKVTPEIVQFQEMQQETIELFDLLQQEEIISTTNNQQKKQNNQVNTTLRLKNASIQYTTEEKEIEKLSQQGKQQDNFMITAAASSSAPAQIEGNNQVNNSQANQIQQLQQTQESTAILLPPSRSLSIFNPVVFHMISNAILNNLLEQFNKNQFQTLQLQPVHFQATTTEAKSKTDESKNCV